MTVTRVQFLDVKVNRDRWSEEVELLEKEISRTIQYFRYMEELFRYEALTGTIAGYAAYCWRMAGVYGNLAEKTESRL